MPETPQRPDKAASPSSKPSSNGVGLGNWFAGVEADVPGRACGLRKAGAITVAGAIPYTVSNWLAVSSHKLKQ
jgi:hypothetical protein